MNDKYFWIDTDPGIDDAVAILWALNNNFNIVGCSAVAGNLGLNTTYTNLCALLDYKNKNIPAYYGASCACRGTQFTASEIHGTNLGPIVIEKKYEFKEHMFQGLINWFESNKDKKLNIIALGPLTNISTFLMHFPKYKEQIECLYIMGGGSYGNITQYGEFNFYSDVEAAYFVFNQGLNIVLSDLDITDNYAYILPEELDEYVSKQKIDNWVEQLLRFIIEREFGSRRALIYDACPIVYIKHSEHYTTEEVYVDIQLDGKTRGLSIYHKNELREKGETQNLIKIKRLTSVDHKKFINLLLDSFVL